MAAAASAITVKYGEPRPEDVFQAAYGCPITPDGDRRIAKASIEQLSDVYWEILSLEHGSEQKPASAWVASEIASLSLGELHRIYNEALAEFRAGYKEISEPRA